MKNLLTKSLALVFGLGVAATFTACHNGEDVPTKVINNVVIENQRTLVINSNVAATFTLGTQTQTGKTATFYPNEPGTVVITAAGRVSKNVEFDFAGGSYLEYDVELEAMGTPVAQNDAEAGTTEVNNAGDNANETGVTVALDFATNNATNTNAAVTDAYSITVVAPTEQEGTVADLDAKKPVEEPVLALECQPSGATFDDKPVLVKLNVPGSDGYELACENDGEPAASFEHVGNNLTIGLSHFSVWDIILKASVENVAIAKEEQTITGDASKGALSYEINYGYEDNGADAFVKKYLKKMFGVAKRTIKKTVNFKKVEGTATLKVAQTVKTYTFKSKEKVFTVKVYTNIEQTLSIETAEDNEEEIKTHDGGEAGK